MKNKHIRIARTVFTGLSAVAVSAIFFNSSLDAVESTAQSDPLVDWINELLRSLHLSLTVDSHFVRKAAHFSEYTVLGILLSVTVYLYLKNCRRTFLLTLPIGLFVAVCDELIQLTSAGRSCEVKDMLIDFSGVTFAAAAVALILILSHRHKRKKEGIQSE